MRQDDLMVGDIVMYHPERIDGDNTWEPYPVRIQNVDIEDNELFEPIPLTKEFLIKNNYQCIDKTYCFLYSHKILPLIEAKDDGSFLCNCVVINYVHQLQHLLRLIGLFDEADDFVINK